MGTDRRAEVLAGSAAFLTRLREEDLAVRVEQVLASAAPGPRINFAFCGPDSGVGIDVRCEWCSVKTVEYTTDGEHWQPATAWWMDRMESHQLWRPFVASTESSHAAQNPVRFPDLYGAWVYHPALMPPPGSRLTSRSRDRNHPYEARFTEWQREMIRCLPAPVDDPDENLRSLDVFFETLGLHPSGG